MQKIVSAVEGKEMMGMRSSLEKIIPKKNIDFSFDPVPHFRIQIKGKETIIIANKKYVDNAEIIFGEYGIGYE